MALAGTPKASSESKAYSWSEFTTSLKRFEGRVVTLLSKADGRDKVLKAALYLARPISKIFEAIGAEHAHKGTDKFAGLLNDARTVTSLVNVFAGVLQRIRASASKVFTLIKALIINEEKVAFEFKLDKNLSYKPSDPDHKRVAFVRQQLAQRLAEYDGKAEMGLGVIAESANVVNGLAYTAGFGICRPTAFAGKFVHLSHNAKKVGEKFGYFMFALHIASFIGAPAEMMRTKIVMDKEDFDCHEEITDVYRDKKISFGLEMTETSLELGVDTITLFFSKQVSPIATLVINSVIGVISLVRAWRATA